MKTIITALIAAAATTAVNGRISQSIYAQVQQSTAPSCTCDVDLLEDGGPFPSGGAGDGVLTGFGQGIAVSQTENIVTVPNTAYQSQCISECCSCENAAH